MAWSGPVELGRQALLGDGHADGVGEALAERSGGRLDARREAVLRVARRPRAPLAEVAQLVQRQVVAGEMQQRVEQHAGVAGRQDEAVAIGPVGPRRGVAQVARPEHVGHRRHAHRRAGVAAVGLLHGVDGQRADGVDRELVKALRRRAHDCHDIRRPVPAHPRSPAPRGRPRRRRRPHVVVLGDLILDIAAQLGRPVAAGSDTPGVIRFRQGGSAANTARRLARLGVRTTFIGAVGRDRWAGPLVDALRRDGVRVRVARVAGPHGSPGGPRRARRGALVRDRPGRRGRPHRGGGQAPGCGGADVLHLPAYSLLAGPVVEAVERAVALARGEGARLSIDLASAAPLLAAGGDDGAADRRPGPRPAVRQPRRGGGDDWRARRRGAPGAGAAGGGQGGPGRLPAADARRPGRPGVAPDRARRGCARQPTRPAPATPSTRASWPSGPRRALPAGLRERDLVRAARAGHRAAQALLAEPRTELRL